MKATMGFLLLAVLAVSCQQPTASAPTASGSSGTQAGQGMALTVTANTSALGLTKAAPASVSKTLLPGTVSFDSGSVTYTLAVTGTSLSFSRTLSNTSGTFGIDTLADGSYAYTLTAASGGVTIGSYGSVFTVAGQPVSLTPALAIPVGTGTLGISLSWPSAYSYTAAVSLAPNGGSAAPLTLTSSSSGGLTTLTYAPTGWAAGNYSLSVTLTQTGASVASWGLQESVFIYAGQVTSLTKTLTSVDLNAPLASGAAPGVTWARSTVDVNAGGTSSFNPVLTWAAVSGAIGYTLQYLNADSIWTDLGTVSSPYTLTSENAGCTKTYRVVAKNLFGSTAQPSVQVAFPTAWYVAAGGTGDGSSILTPSGDFQSAVDQAYVASLLHGGAQQTVKVTAGSFTPDRWPSLTAGYQNATYQVAAWKHFTLRSHVLVEGGYTSDFSSVTSRSVFAGGGTVYHVFYQSAGVTGTELRNAEIGGGNASGATYASSSGGGFLVGCAPDGTPGSGAYAWNGGTLTLTNCLFTGNTAVNDGGGLSVSGGLTASPILRLVNCRFTSNSSTGTGYSGGGAVTVQGTSAYPVTFQASGGATGSSSNDFYLNTSALNAGALVLKYVQATVQSLAFCANSGANGGALFSQISALSLQSVFLDSNTGSGSGGGLCFLGASSASPSSLTLTSVSFTGNHGRVGGGAYLESASLTTSGTLSLVQNQATGGQGGGFYFTGSSGTLAGASFSQCTSTDTGGAIYSSGALPGIVGCSFTQNQGSHGGALYLLGGGAVTITGSTFQSNVSNLGSYYGNGGAIYLENTNPAFKDCQFTGNSAYEGGGAVFINNIVQPLVTTFTRCIFTGNTASLGGGGNAGGGAIHEYGICAGTTDVFLFCLFHDNMDNLGLAHAIYAAANPIALVKTTVANNGGSLQAGNQVVLYGSNPSLIALSIVNSWVANTDPVGNFYTSLQAGQYNADATYTLTSAAQANGLDSIAGIASMNFLATSDLTAFSVSEFAASNLSVGVGVEKFYFSNPGWADVSYVSVSSGTIPSPALNGAAIGSTTELDLGCNEQGL